MTPSPGRGSDAHPDRGVGRAAPPSAATALRARTTLHHRDTEAAYGSYDLTDRRSYVLFLQAHLRAVTAAERSLAASTGLPAWRPRAPFLRDDLDALGAAAPAPLPFPGAFDTDGAWGVLYVLEGSRIGSQMLSRRVPQDQPRSYLAAAHGPGEWRGFCARLDARLATPDESELDRAVAAAIACFNLFTAAAHEPLQPHC